MIVGFLRKKSDFGENGSVDTKYRASSGRCSGNPAKPVYFCGEAVSKPKLEQTCPRRLLAIVNRQLCPPPRSRRQCRGLRQAGYSAFRNSLGAIPTVRRNAWAKWLGLVYPTSSAISMRLREVSRINRCALSMRSRVTNCRGVIPVDCLNTRQK